MAQTNTFINKTLLLSFLALSLAAKGQRFGVKPLIGIHYNQTKVSANENLLFIKGNQSLSYTLGLMLTYRLYPKWDLELGFISIPNIQSYTAYHPTNYKQIANVNYTYPKQIVTFNTSYILNSGKKHNTKLIGGIEFFNKPVIIGGAEFKYEIDTNHITFDYPPTPSKSVNPLFRIWTGINLGISYEVLYKKRSLTEIRFTTRYDMSQKNRMFIGYKQNGIVYTNFAQQSPFSCNLSLMLNLSTLLGTDWKRKDE